MVAFTVIAGAVISVFVGWFIAEFVFGKSSTSGYHGTRGRYKSKHRGSWMKLAKIVSVGAIAMFLTAPAAAVLVAIGPVLTVVVAFIAVFVYLHLDINHWNII